MDPDGSINDTIRYRVVASCLTRKKERVHSRHIKNKPKAQCQSPKEEHPCSCS